MRKLFGGIFIAAVAAFGLVACGPVGSSGPDLTCANKVISEITTDKAVAGTWACLTPKFQSTLRDYVAAGALISADDAVFTDGTSTPAPVVTSSYVGSANGVAVYTVVIKTNGTVETFSITVWLDSSGKVDNLNVTGPLF
jgi:hypothetical protein